MGRRLVFLGLLLAGCGGGDGGTSDGCTVTLKPGADDDTTVQTALIEAMPGDQICFDEGTFVFHNELSLTVNMVTLRGKTTDREKAVLDFAMQDAGANGISITGDDFTMQDLWVKNTQGDGIRVQNASRVIFRNVKVTWDAGSATENGAYAIYPVTCTDVLIQGCEVSGASDAGIYVGQSDRIIVEGNDVHGNVAGIEIENSHDAEVRMNHAHDNTGGILAFNLPSLPVQDGRRCRIHDNVIENNNTMNFAAAGNIVGYVPTGTGMLILAADEIEIDHNMIMGNETGGSIVASYLALMMPANDPMYDEYPETIWIHDNTYASNGSMPQGLLVLANQPMLEDILWDGFVDATKDNSDGSLSICIRMNGTATFRNLDAPGDFMNESTDVTPHDCMHPSLPAVTLQGVTP